MNIKNNPGRKIKKAIVVPAAFIVLLTFSASRVLGQDILPERPGQTISAHTLKKGTLQLEAGFVYEGDKPEDTRLHNITPLTTLVRYGLFNRIELRAGMAVFNRNYTVQGIYHHEFSDARKGLYPATLGLKIHLLENRGIIPSVAFTGSLAFPQLATREYAPAHIAPDARLSIAYHLYRGVSTSYNLGLSWDGNKNLPSFLYTALLSVDHGKRLTSFYELYGFVPPEAVATDVRFDAGLSWLVYQDLRIDIEGGLGLTDFAPDFYVGAGLAWRILK